MDKTLHKKLTENTYGRTKTLAAPGGEDMRSGALHEMYLLREAARDLLRPRPEAVANLLRMAREI